MNLKELANRLEIEEEECLEFLALFKKTSASELWNLESALEKRDAPVIERMAHSMKGAAGSLGLKEIYEAAKRIETAARTNRLEEIEADLRIIKEKLEMIAEALKRGS